MAMSKKITIYDEKKGYGANAQTGIANSKTIWCSEEEVSVRNSFYALSAGITVSKQVVIWKREYDGQSYAEVSGAKYKIVSVHNSRDSALKLLVMLERRN